MSGYPLTEPDVMPATISRLKKVYMISIGMVMVLRTDRCEVMQRDGQLVLAATAC